MHGVTSFQVRKLGTWVVVKYFEFLMGNIISAAWKVHFLKRICGRWW